MNLAKKRSNEFSSSLDSGKKSKMENTQHTESPFSNLVMMPWDDRREILMTKGGTTKASTKWAIIQSQLNPGNPILNFNDLINVIKSYNVICDKSGKQSAPPWKFLVLQNYFLNLDSCEVRNFFMEGGILSTIRNLALQLKELVPRLSILRAGCNGNIKLHQMQLASLLANAFLCTFPKGETNCPSINFITLYEGSSDSILNHKVEKIKCIIHYFERIHKKQPTGLLSFHRLCIPDYKFPRWDKTNIELSSLMVDAKGKIEDQSEFLQVDFANKYVGGGVLGRGCVQEEIRFIICPELIASRLFTECLADNEALLVVGAERFSNYSGYANTFKFVGDFRDSTPFDDSRRRKSYIIAIDALCYTCSEEQYRESKILRELKKAYVGFKPLPDLKALPLATGNWGCGAFGGDPQLKSILQLMASSQAGRKILYLTFGDVILKNQMNDLYRVLKENSVNVGTLYQIIRLYYRDRRKNQSVFEFVKESICEREKRMSVSSVELDSKSISFPQTSTVTSVVPKSFNDSLQKLDVNETIFEKPENQSNAEDDRFPDIEMDFELLDREIDLNKKNFLASRSDTSPEFVENAVNTHDTSRYEDSDSADLKPKFDVEEMDVTVCSQSLFSEEEKDEEINQGVGSKVSLGQVESRDAKARRSPPAKKLVQRKITDCFFRK